MSRIAMVRQPRKDTLATRRQIVDAAEALFAEHGVDAVTLLDIARAAGQKNRNAPQYHFGDKAGLINAVLDKHGDLISVRRKAMMERFGTGQSPTLRDLVEAYVLPVATHVADTENAVTYLLLHSQLMTSSSFAALTGARIERYPEVRQLQDMMDRLLATDSRAERASKILLIQTMVFHGLAGFYSSGASHRQRFVQTLCAAVEAVLTARPAT
jgi:AcrR family transcriptional regulator